MKGQAEAALKKKQKKSKALDFQKAFDTDAGKRVRELLKEFTGYGIAKVPTDSAGRLDPYELARNEGKRAVMCHIEAMLEKNINEKKQEKAEL